MPIDFLDDSEAGYAEKKRQRENAKRIEKHREFIDRAERKYTRHVEVQDIVLAEGEEQDGKATRPGSETERRV